MSWVARVTALIDMMVCAALPGGGGSTMDILIPLRRNVKMADIKITALKNGPYKVEGPIELFYGDSRVDTSQPTVFLCRCGASSKKPFCDGTHSKIGFQAAAATVPESKEE